MLVLIATNELQGTTLGDYAFTVEGELVTPVVTECSNSEHCGCNRGFPGLASAKATTTAMIVERPGVSEVDLRDALFDWLDRGGWIELLEQTTIERSVAAGHHDGPSFADLEEVDMVVGAIIDEHIDMITEICATYPEGSVITRFGPLIADRSHPFAA